MGVELAGIPPLHVDRFQAVLPPSYALPPEFPPIAPNPPLVPVLPPGMTIVTPPTPTPNIPPGTTPPPGSPPLIPPPTTPPLNPPDSPPPVTAVPEPDSIYLFLITFVLSLYGLTRMMPSTPNERDVTDKSVSLNKVLYKKE